MYQIYVDGDVLPITPGKIQTKINNQNKTITLIDLGEVNLLKSPGLTEISFDAVLPHTTYPFAAASASIPGWLDRFERLKAGRETFRLIVARIDATFDTNMLVSLEDYTIKEDAANQGRDVVVTPKFKQHRPYGTKTVTVKQSQTLNSKATATVTQQRPAKSPATSHTVVAGDTLWGICKKYLGDGSRYPEVAKANGITNPNVIYPGQVIRFE